MEILEFSWLPALAGGIMIGTASAVVAPADMESAALAGSLSDHWLRP